MPFGNYVVYMGLLSNDHTNITSKINLIQWFVGIISCNFERQHVEMYFSQYPLLWLLNSHFPHIKHARTVRVLPLDRKCIYIHTRIIRNVTTLY